MKNCYVKTWVNNLKTIWQFRDMTQVTRTISRSVDEVMAMLDV